MMSWIMRHSPSHPFVGSDSSTGDFAQLFDFKLLIKKRLILYLISDPRVGLEGVKGRLRRVVVKLFWFDYARLLCGYRICRSYPQTPLHTS
jgi:hypothetical protein